MSEAKRFSSALLLALLLIVGLAGSASAQRMLDGPRAAGTVGEGYDGFAVVHGAASSDVARLVDSVNAERRQIYAQRAQAQNAPASEIGKVYAAEILKQAPAGTWFLSESGQWTQKK
jgi:uncharacterized protein YdbL (DUF1318 family)